MTLVTSHPLAKYMVLKKVGGTANAACKSKHSNVGTMSGNPLPTDIYFPRATVAARFSKHPKLDLLAQDFGQLD